jgi:hypothetical protein
MQPAAGRSAAALVAARETNRSVIRGVVPRIHVFVVARAWMAVTTTAMTGGMGQCQRDMLSWA